MYYILKISIKDLLIISLFKFQNERQYIIFYFLFFGITNFFYKNKTNSIFKNMSNFKYKISTGTIYINIRSK